MVMYVTLYVTPFNVEQTFKADHFHLLSHWWPNGYSRCLSDVKCTVRIWRSWIWTPVRSNLRGCSTSVLSCTWSNDIFDHLLLCKLISYANNISLAYTCSKCLSVSTSHVKSYITSNYTRFTYMGGVCPDLQNLYSPLCLPLTSHGAKYVTFSTYLLTEDTFLLCAQVTWSGHMVMTANQLQFTNEHPVTGVVTKINVKVI